jgi:hypothetical protein
MLDSLSVVTEAALQKIKNQNRTAVVRSVYIDSIGSIFKNIQPLSIHISYHYQHYLYDVSC